MNPPLYPRDASSWFALFKRHLTGSGFSLEQPGEPVYTLAQLFAEMMAESARLLNQTPEKHRLAFLNTLQLPRRRAQAAEGFAVFQISAGCEQSVTIPQGTLLAAEREDGPILFQTTEEFQAHPIRLEEAWWSDPDSDTAECVLSEGRPLIPFSPGQRTAVDSLPHRLEMAVPEVFCNRGGRHRVTFSARLAEPDILADPDRFRWSIRLPGEKIVPLRVSRHPSGKLSLDLLDCPVEDSPVWVQLELRDPEFLSIQLEQPRFFSEGNEISPTRVCSGDHQQNPEVFYPFQNPLQPYEQCLIFSDEGLFHPGAELTLSFDLRLECREEREPELLEPIDYRWIMRKPLPKPKPAQAQAYAQEVLLEYWNGSRFAPLPAGNLGVLSQEQVQLSLKFFCPPDLAPQEEGYCLRLSCGGCEALYALPRRVCTPRIEHLRFAYASLNPAEPLAVRAWNFGERIELPLDKPIQPFRRPPGGGRSIYLGFDSLPSNEWLQLLIQTEPLAEQSKESLACELPDGRGLLIQDGTHGLTQSGLISCLIPEKAVRSERFGSRKYWLHFRVPASAPRWIQQIFLNAGRIRNLLFSEEVFPLDRIPRSGQVILKKGGLAEVRVAVRQAGEWIPWVEYQPKEGRFREGFFRADADRGQIFLPPEFFTLFPTFQTDDVLRVSYAVTDGQRGNLPAGRVTSIQTEIPFITGVSNPLPILNGGAGEPDEALALRSEHWLHHAGRAVTSQDYELLAADFCPLVRQARCLPGNPIRLVLDLDSSREVFPQVRQGLLEKLNACGAAPQYGIPLEILPAKRMPLRIRVSVIQSPGLNPAVLQIRLRHLFADYLHPSQGWRIGELPDEALLAQRLEALGRRHGPELGLPERTSLRISCTWVEPLSPLDLPGGFQLELLPECPAAL